MKSAAEPAANALRERAEAFTTISGRRIERVYVPRDLDGIGELLDRAWQVKKRFSPRISNTTLDRIYDGARAAGALGGKVTGAGGGGHMVFYCHPERRGDILRYLAAHNFPIVPFAFEPKGLQTWRVNPWGSKRTSGAT